MNYNYGDKNQVKMMLFIYSVSVMLVFGLVFLIGLDTNQGLRANLLNDEKHVVGNTSTIITTKFEGIYSDIIFLRDQVNAFDNAEDIENLFVNFSRSRGVYDQIRLINTSGHEVIRANNQNGFVNIQPVQDLQDKSDRYYVKNTFDKKLGEIYISPIDLNVENGTIEVPYKPVLRIGTRLEDNKGIVVINYAVNDLWEELKSYDHSNTGHLYVLNQEGYYLYSNNDKLNYAFMWDEESDTFFDEYNKNKVSMTAHSQVIENDGVFSFDFIDVGFDNYGLISEEKEVSKLFIISHIEPYSNAYDLIQSTPLSFARDVLGAYYYVFILLLPVAIFLSAVVSIEKRRNQVFHETLEFTAKFSQSIVNQDFLEAVVRYLTNEYDVKYAYVRSIKDGHLGKMVVISSEGEILNDGEALVEALLDKSAFVMNSGDEVPNNRIGDLSLLLAKLKQERTMMTPLLDSEGNPLGVLGLADESFIKNRFELEVALRVVKGRTSHELENLNYDNRLKELLRFNEIIVDAVDQGIIVYDNKFKIEEWNRYAEKLTSINKNDVINKSILDVIPTFKNNGIYEDLNSTLASQSDTSREIDYFNDSEHAKFVLRVVNQCLYDLKGNQIGIISTITDITEFKLKEIAIQKEIEKSETANKTKSRFLANMSHEIRTPLNGILGMTDLTLMSELKPEQVDNLNLIKKSGVRLHKLINDILDLSKLDESKLEMVYDYFDLHEFIHEIESINRTQAKAKNLLFKFDYDQDLPSHINLDALRLSQVLNNLLSNALKFTNDGQIRFMVNVLNVDTHHVKIRFMVQDTGIGVAPDKRKLIFGRFTQADESTSKTYGGAGLGLSISKLLIEQMGGSLEFESLNPCGSAFYFDITCGYRRENRNAKETKNLENGRHKFGEITVLVVEDDEINQRMFGKFLKMHGLNYDTADDGEIAVRMFDSNMYDLIFMDINMPNLNGIQTLKIIKSSEKYRRRRIPIIAQTANAMNGDREKMLDHGFEDYISKPLDFDKVIDLISEWT